MKFRSFTLDPFQEEAVDYINQGKSVIVSAATGTGKTLIADYLIDKYVTKKMIIYTAPIKALSNQKYRDFKELYGEENVGLMTGDVVINPEAPVLIMTTEIYRNMLLTKDTLTETVKYVIFDEIHFINDIERGTVWEESIIFSPDHVRFLCLSATIPNAREFADWIESIKKHKVAVVSYMKRAVPLKHFIFDKMVGITTAEKFKEELRTPDYNYVMGRQRTRKKQLPRPYPEELIECIKDKLPCLFFVFSRKECETKARMCSKRFSFLDSKKKADIAALANQIIPPEYRAMESVRSLKEVLPKGIAFHHAGMLPYSKELVERLFAKGLIQVLFATETFAVGINMPAKSVAFNSVFKYDGINFRHLNCKEYFQMAGRAGRRGIDKVGYVYVMFDRREDDIEKIKHISSQDVEPIRSQYKLSFNTVLNMVNNYPERLWETILKSSFDYYQQKKKRNIRIMATFNNKMKLLVKLNFIRDNQLTEKGIFARRIYESELLVTQIFISDLWKRLNKHEIAVLCAAIIYEPGRNDRFAWENLREAKGLINFMRKNVYNRKLNLMAIKNLYSLVTSFTKGDDFSDIMQFTNLQEGDVIRLFRRTIDLVRQIRHAASDRDLQDRCSEVLELLHRVPVKVEL